MQLALKIFEARECGECTACCTHLPIGAGIVSREDKPAGKPCGYLCMDGCGIYRHRPQVCAKFNCAWLSNSDWPDAWRPNESGLLCLREMLDVNLPAALVYEIRRDALQQPATAEILSELVRISVIVAVISLDQHRQVLQGQWQVSPPVALEPVAAMPSAA